MIKVTDKVLFVICKMQATAFGDATVLISFRGVAQPVDELHAVIVQMICDDIWR